VGTFFQPHEANMAEAMLRAHGVSAVIHNEVGVYPNLEQTAVGVELKVPAAEAEEAKSLLDAAHSAAELFDDEEE